MKSVERCRRTRDSCEISRLSLLRISEAASLAFHALAFFARRGGKRVSNRELAAVLNASEHTLSKALQRLAGAGMIRGFRGPNGGFVLARPAAEITLLEVYEAVEGRLPESGCLLGEPACDGRGCVLGGLLESVANQAREYLTETTLDQVGLKLNWRENK